MDEKSYYLVRFDTLNVDEDFNTFVSFLSSVPELTVTPEGNQVVLSYQQKDQGAIFKKITPKTIISTPASMLIQCKASDYDTLQIFREIAPRIKYRIYNPNLGCFFPNDINLIDVSQLIFQEKEIRVFRTKGYGPLFSYFKTNLFYAQPVGQQAVHFLNPAMFSYFVDYDLDESSTPEFSYEVAPNLIEFIAFHNQDLIPANYYQYYQKSLKIINLSGFDLEHVNRKIFIKPWFFLYDKTKQEYSLMTSEKSALHLADKIRQGETLDTTIKRILREEVKMAEDYIRAKVTKIEFDRDRDGVLTPRLWVSIYLKEIKNKEAVKEKSQRGWTSLKDEVS